MTGFRGGAVIMAFGGKQLGTALAKACFMLTGMMPDSPVASSFEPSLALFAVRWGIFTKTADISAQILWCRTDPGG